MTNGNSAEDLDRIRVYTVAISDDHAHALYKLAHMTGFVGWLNELRKSLYAAPQAERAPREAQPVAEILRLLSKMHDECGTNAGQDALWDAHEAVEQLLAAPTPERTPREAKNVMNIPLDAAATMADYVPQAECASRAEDPDWMGKLPKCTEWPSGVAPRAEPVEESDVRPKERLCGGSHISCNGVDYCLGHPSCRDIANERAKKEQK
jgi:hypothetical protein